MKYLVCNLKANKTKEELTEYEQELAKVNTNPKVKLIICPPTPFLYLFQSQNYELGSQDVSSFDVGPYTGENTAEQLASLNVKYALIGHSERRYYFQEEDSVLSNKIKKSYHNHIRPIYFIGEMSNEKDNFYEIIKKEIINVIDKVPEYKRASIIIAYEPRWSIGTGLLPTNEEIYKRVDEIKKILKKEYNLTLPILYGGSVNKNNIKELIEIKNLDGFVLGESAQEYNNVKIIYKILL